MNKPKTILFREIDGIYTDVAGDSETLCEYLLSHGIENIPEGKVFMRIKNAYFYAQIYSEYNYVKILVYDEYKHDTKIQHSCER